MLCGYHKCLGTLQFHHLSNGKDSDISKIHTYGKLDREIKKCIVVCANCHAEIHAGMHKHISVPTYRDTDNEPQAQSLLFDMH